MPNTDDMICMKMYSAVQYTCTEYFKYSGVIPYPTKRKKDSSRIVILNIQLEHPCSDQKSRCRGRCMMILTCSSCSSVAKIDPPRPSWYWVGSLWLSSAPTSYKMQLFSSSSLFCKMLLNWVLTRLQRQSSGPVFFRSWRVPLNQFLIKPLEAITWSAEQADKVVWSSRDTW